MIGDQSTTGRDRRGRRRQLPASARGAKTDARCTYTTGEHGGSASSSHAAAPARAQQEGQGRRRAARQRGPAPCSAGRLGNTANRSSTHPDPEAEAKRSAARRRRYELRSDLWELTTLTDRLKWCGRTIRTPGGSVGLRAPGDGSAGFSGLVSCGSVWACPVCASKIAAERASELGAVLAWAVEQGHTVAMATLTMQHHAGQSLAESWDALTTAWSGRVTSGSGWASETEERYLERLSKWEHDRANGWKGSRRRARPDRRVGLAERFGVLGWARAVEVLHGSNGWHPHVHVILILDGPVSDDRVRVLGEALSARWERGLNAHGYTARRDHGGLDIRRAYNEHDLAAYVAKQLALEATHGHAKTGRSDLRAPFQIVADLTITGDADDLATWHEWERASKGRRQLTWSEGIRQLAGLAAEQRTDEEVAADDLGSEDLILIDSSAWNYVAPRQAELLEAAARGGVAAAITWLDHELIPQRGKGEPYIITPEGYRALGRTQHSPG